MASLVVASAYPYAQAPGPAGLAYPYAQAPGPAGLAYPKAGPNGHFQVCTNLHLHRNRVALRKIKMTPKKSDIINHFPYLYFAYISKLYLP